MSQRILVIPGSTRSAALSKQFAAAAGRHVTAAGGQATVVDLRDHAMPLYDGDLEAERGLPEGAVSLRELVKAHDALLFVSPEYNASIPAVLKNAIDWLSRPHGDESGGVVFAGKVAGLASSSPGALGGMRGLVHLRQVLMNLGVLVITEQVSLGNAHEAFGDDGELTDERGKKGLDKVVGALLRIAARLGG